MAIYTHSRKRFQKVILAGVSDGALTTSRDWNIAGLSSAIALATQLRTQYSAHVADVTEVTGEHKALHTAGQLATTSIVPYNLTSLLVLTNDLTAKYKLHNADAIAVAPTYHQAQDTTHALAAETTVTTLSGAITRLNDIKAKFNLHDAESTAHTTGSKYQVDAANAAFGTEIRVNNDAVRAGDFVMWSILDDGTGNVTGVSATSYDGYIKFKFSADPQDDCIVSYLVAAD